MRKTLALTSFALMVVAANAFAVGEGRIGGKITDAATHQPIIGATVKMDAVSGHTVHAETKTDKNGDYKDMFGVLAEAYEKSGQKDKAAEYRKKLPADSNSLFNEAARLINEGKDNQAEPLLKQAITANDKMAVAYYELGMLYVRSSK